MNIAAKQFLKSRLFYTFFLPIYLSEFIEMNFASIIEKFCVLQFSMRLRLFFIRKISCIYLILNARTQIFYIYSFFYVAIQYISIYCIFIWLTQELHYSIKDQCSKKWKNSAIDKVLPRLIQMLKSVCFLYFSFYFIDPLTVIPFELF